MFRKLVLILFLFICTACAEPYETEDADLFIMVTADLHVTEMETVSAVVPLAAYSVRLCETVTEEVIGCHPDVFVICGDNTNSGRQSDEVILKGMLERIRDAGIQVIMVPGNHDLNMTGPDTYREVFEDLIEADDRDPASLSYMKETGNVMFIAMDDSSYDPDRKGRFSNETMSWLKNKLRQAEKDHRKVIFISHHNVLFDDGKGNYGILNSGLVKLLKRYHVQLCLSGHTHSQNIIEDEGLHEIVSGAPMSGAHLIGSLRIRGDDVEYSAEPLDFLSYGDMYDTVEYLDRDADESMKEIFTNIFLSKGYSEEDAVKMTQTAGRFLHYYSLGTLHEHQQEILDDPYCEMMLEGLKDDNYGPWMDTVLHSELRRADSLSFEYR